MKDKEVLVIGSRGQLASCLKEIAEAKWRFIGRLEVDICDKKQVAKIIRGLKPNLIINTSAYTAVDKAEQNIDEAYRINSEALENIALECMAYNIPLIHISTDYVFDGKKTTGYTEEDAPNPLSIYGKSKLEGEDNIRRHLKNHIIIRTSWVFSHYGTNFVKTMINLVKTSKPLKIIDDQIGCPTAAINLAHVIKQISDNIFNNEAKVLYGTYNYSDKLPLSWYEFARQIFKILTEKYDYPFPEVIPISSVEYNSLAARPQNSVLECSLISRNFGIKQYDWLIELENCIKKLI